MPARLGNGLLLSMLLACSNANALPEDYLGRWYYVGSSGGIAGDGLQDAASGYIVVLADNVLERYDDEGTRIGTSTFEVERGRTIFSEEDQWTLTFEEGQAHVIILSKSGSEMSLSENVYDGIGLNYARSR